MLRPNSICPRRELPCPPAVSNRFGLLFAVSPGYKLEPRFAKFLTNEMNSGANGGGAASLNTPEHLDEPN